MCTCSFAQVYKIISLNVQIKRPPMAPKHIFKKMENLEIITKDNIPVKQYICINETL